MSEFDIKPTWLPFGGNVQATQSDATFCKLEVTVGDKNVTEYIDEKRATFSHVQLPAYPLAEWIAENWWPLLWEPRKNEDDGDNAEFLRRHSTLTAQHGFALPKIVMVAAGNAIEISSVARDVPFSNVRFKNSANVSCTRQAVEASLRTFVSSVVERLDSHQIKDTCLQDYWSLISETRVEEALFCRFAGTLGLSPYEIDEKTASLIERLLPKLGERVLMDLCAVSSKHTFSEAATLAEKAIDLTQNARESTLSPLDPISPPADNTSLPAHRRGRRGAEFVRQRFGIKDTDPHGATKVFEALQIDTSRQTGQPADDASITGAVVRDDKTMKVALLQPLESKRRFSAGRAVFSAWSAENPTESHLLTSAVTRDQQSNRAFAAELTAPHALIKKRSPGNRLTKSAMFELAAELQIGPDVISKQAMNNGIRVSPL